ncbi:uncharacterized protein LOC105254594 isoform X2 [Camponotus floridanus]|uniref:uncharacterized protein LOC105254594 isoform X2 n=1 Tax=Camponotus floridanus TaxID=104421 RepID=UPI000DC68EB2|nr:uncharacterized protein LOC105254594 isoform X2 [Camponotus floridanus]
MGGWSAEHRAFAVERFFRNNSYTVTVREFRKKFQIARTKPVFSDNTLRLWVKNFRETGSVLKKKPPGPPLTVRTSPTIAKVRLSLENSPSRSARLHAQNLKISDRTLRRILHEDLNFHPYKIMYTQQLKVADHKERIQFSRTMLQKIKSREVPLEDIMITDEAHFYLNGDVNKQNVRYWSDENPRVINEKPLHSPKVTVWMGVSKWGVIGPFFFGGMVNGERYRELLTNFVRRELTKKKKLSRTWFQQDGAPCHTANETMTVLRKMFGNRLISRTASLSWPPRSPDLSVCDFFLWGYLKSRVYETKPKDLEELKTEIRRHAAAIPKSMLEKVYDSFVKRLENCVKNKVPDWLDPLSKARSSNGLSKPYGIEDWLDSPTIARFI